MNAKPAAEESIALRVAVLVAVMAAAVAVLQQDVGSGGLRLGVALIPAAFWFSWWARHREGFWVKAALAVGALVAFGHFLTSVGTGVESLGSAQVPLAELFLWVQLLHAFDVPARRDLMFSLVSSLVLVAVAGVLSVSMDLVLPLAVWSVAAAVALVLAHGRELAELPALGGAGRRLGMASVAGPVALVLVAVVLVGTAAFFVLPPASEARALAFPRRLPNAVPVPRQGGLSNPSLGDDGSGGGPGGGSGARSSFGWFGFSRSLDTSARGRPGDTLVMRVRASRADFWKGQTFDTWDGRQWTIADERPVPIGGSSPIEVPTPRGEPSVFEGGELVQTYYLRTPGPNLVFGANRVAQLWFPDRRLFQLPDGTLRAGVGLDEGATYTVVSRRADVTVGTLMAADRRAMDLPSALAARYTQLPSGGAPARVAQLARDVTAGAPTVYEKVRAIEAWMGANLRYSLDVPPLPDGDDAVERFLFVDRVGFCEQIGTALVVMLRSLGIPARLAAGYAPGQRNPFTGLFEVRADDAHAWAEVWFPGIGWQGFDPTASVPLAGDSSLASAGSGLPSYLSARLPHVPGWALTAAGIAALCVGAGAVLVRVLRARRLRRGAPAPSWASVCLGRIEAVGVRLGRARRASETVREYCRSLRRLDPEAARLLDVAAVVERAAYAPSPVGADERHAVEAELDRLNDVVGAGR